MRNRWAYLRLFLVLAVLSLATSACERAGREVPFSEDEGVPQVGSVAPDFTLHDLAGSPVTLSTLRGKVVLVNFWATWCVPCKREMPSMEILYQELKDRGLEILAGGQVTVRALINPLVLLVWFGGGLMVVGVLLNMAWPRRREVPAVTTAREPADVVPSPLMRPMAPRERGAREA